MKSIKAFWVVLLLVLPMQVWSDTGVIIQNQTATAKEVNLFVGQSDPKKTFKFSNGEAWLDANGSFEVRLEVIHHKLLCAQYRSAIRFGQGNPGCQQVNWDSDMIKLTSKRQCNSAELVHFGSNTLDYLAQRYGEMTCAEVKVTCSGKFCR
ncbi:MAG: hypothetical protein OQK12_14445 [Motiliproteus sp.]|nr:hypothetical protein [Motiliproteus sp.]